METKTSKEWFSLLPPTWEITILDPDGWDRSNYDYSFHKEKITKEEFMKRLRGSSIRCNPKYYGTEW